MNDKKLTPMMRQYFEIKEKNANAILFFRLGDFYEMFGPDAITASKILGITLTARGKGGDNEVPMCGVPYHAAENYIAKLTRAGKNVAICEQLTEAGNGIVERGIVRIITPGTTLNDSILDGKGNNYIISVIPENFFRGNTEADTPSVIFALAVCDLTTGEFNVAKIKREKVKEELSRLCPAEIVLDEDSDLADFLYDGEVNISYFNTYRDKREILINHFKVKNLEGFGMEKEEMLTEAAGLLLEYLKETQKTDLAHIRSLRVYSAEDCMILDETTIRNLELILTLRDGQREGSLLNVIDKTSTSMGARRLKHFLLRPLQNKECIEKRLNGVKEIFENATLRSELRDILSDIADIERLLGKISLNSCSPRDISSLRESLEKVPAIKEWISEVQSEILHEIAGGLCDHGVLTRHIEKTLKPDLPHTLKDGGVIADGVSRDLDELRNISKNSKKILVDLALRESERTGIASLKVKFNNVFGYYIEISNANKHLVPDDYIRKQTLVNAERYITPELKELEEKILGAEEKIIAIEKVLFEELRERVLKDVADIQRTAYMIGCLDVLVGFATLAKERNYTCPEIIGGEVADGNPSDVLEIKDGRHPVIESLTFENSFVPNDTFLSRSENFIMLITGPNMAGKSTYLRQVALITLLAHIGSFVPAGRARIPLTDRIFTRVGASDNLAKGQSTFMVEMQEAANILNNATSRSLIILDEIGRGTSTYDGVSIAWAILEYVHDTLKSKTLFATHYHELIAVADKLENACNWSVSVAEQQTRDSASLSPDKRIIFLHKIVPGGIYRSYGIEVARLAGLPREIINRANSIMKNLEEGVVDKGIQKALRSERVPETQQDLFSQPTVKSVVPAHLERTHKALQEIDPVNMTPMEALQKLDELKRMQGDAS